LKHFLGEDVKFFDLIPIRYVTDVADVLAIAKYLWTAVKEFRR
jgi:hypothetical protein